MNIIRVFPRQTSCTPNDGNVFIGRPPLPGMRPPADEVHISVTFTWDLPLAAALAADWGQFYPTVKLGGPATDLKTAGPFIPGKYIKNGITFTSRGCNNHCPPCLVPKYEGRLVELADFPDGNIIQDNNLAQCSQAHRERVFDMLRRQPDKAYFKGGIEASLVDDWWAAQLKTIRVGQVFLACDTPAAIHPLQRAVEKIGWLGNQKLFCYVMIGRESLDQARARLESVYSLGCMPFAQLYQPADGWIDYSPAWKDLARDWSRPAITRTIHRASSKNPGLLLIGGTT